MVRKTTQKKAAKANTTNKPSSPSGELAQALSLLNQRIEPQPAAQQALQAVAQQRAQAKPSNNKVVKLHVLPFEGYALLGFALAAPQPVALVKLLDPQQKVPLLGSAGEHVPASFGQAAQFAFAQFAGLRLQANANYVVQLVYADGTFSQLPAVAEVLGAGNLSAVLKLCTEGKAALAALLKQDKKADSELRKLVGQLAELEKRYAMPYVGKVDEIIGGVVEGWVWCPAKPLNRYEVQAWCGERLVGYGMANIWRADLERLNKDDGRLKFEIPLARHLFDGQTHTIHMKVVGQGEPDRTLEFGSPLTFNAPKRSVNTEHLQLMMGYALSLQVATALATKLKNAIEQQTLVELMPKVCLHLENREPAQARRLAEQAIEQAPKAKALWSIKLAESYMLEKQFDKAVEHYGNAVKAGKDFIWAHMGLGEAHQQLGNTAKALKVFENAQAISPNYAPLQAKLSALRARALLELKDTEALPTEQLETMVQQGKRALLNNPNNIELSRVLVRLQQRLQGKPHADDHLDAISPEQDNLRHHRLVLEATLDLLTPPTP